LLAQLCSIATFWALYQLARAIVGGQHAVLAVLLTLTVTAFSSPGLEFGPLVLARPLWALLLLHSWQLLGQRRRNAWFAWSIEAGLLLLTIPSAIGLLLLIAIFALATERGRRTLMSFDALFALLVIVVLVLPYLVWVIRADALALPLADHSLDLITIAFGFRNLANYEHGFRELLRVLKPGGTVAILEFSQPTNRMFGALYRFFSGRVLPWIGGLISGSREAYSYLPESIRKFPGAEELAERMRAAGFAQVEFERMTGGAVALHIGRK